MTESSDVLKARIPTKIKKGILGEVATRVLLGKPDAVIINNSEYQATIPVLRGLYEQVWRWHGTGRFQHTEHGVRDVLEGIIENKGLVPHPDPLDPTYGKMESISTSPSRTYSALYAQLHFEKGKRLRNFISTATGWMYYVGHIAVMAAMRDRRIFSKEFREQHSLTKEGTAYIHAKYTKEPTQGRSWVVKGGISDIPGNYPMVIGIKEGAFKEGNISLILQKYESRAITPIALTDITHIEVPRQNVLEVEGFLRQKGVDTPIIPLEWGEEFSKSLPVSFLKDGVPLGK